VKQGGEKGERVKGAVGHVAIQKVPGSGDHSYFIKQQEGASAKPSGRVQVLT